MIDFSGSLTPEKYGDLPKTKIDYLEDSGVGSFADDGELLVILDTAERGEKRASRRWRPRSPTCQTVSCKVERRIKSNRIEAKMSKYSQVSMKSNSEAPVIESVVQLGGVNL